VSSHLEDPSVSWHYVEVSMVVGLLNTSFSLGVLPLEGEFSGLEILLVKNTERRDQLIVEQLSTKFLRLISPLDTAVLETRLASSVQGLDHFSRQVSGV